MTRVSYQAGYPAGVDFVLGTLIDEAFLHDYAREVGAQSWDVTVERLNDVTRTRLLLTVVTQGIPAVFKRLVPPTLDIVESRTWPSSPVNGEVSGSVAVDAAVAKRQATVRGTVLIAPVETGSSFAMSGDIVVQVPLVGDRAATLVKDLILGVLGKQTIVMNRRIAGR